MSLYFVHVKAKFLNVFKELNIIVMNTELVIRMTGYGKIQAFCPSFHCTSHVDLSCGQRVGDSLYTSLKMVMHIYGLAQNTKEQVFVFHFLQMWHLYLYREICIQIYRYRYVYGPRSSFHIYICIRICIYTTSYKCGLNWYINRFTSI